VATFRLVAVLLLAFLFLPLPANAIEVTDVTITCKSEAGDLKTYDGVGWDNDNEYFADKGYIPAQFCEDIGTQDGYPLYDSDDLSDTSLGYYAGARPVVKPSPEPSPEPSAEPTASPEPTQSPEPEPEPEPEPTVSQEVYDQLVKEYDDYKAWAEQAIADYKGTISGLSKKIDSVNEALANKDKTIEELRSALDAYKLRETESKDKIASLNKQLSEALETLAKSKSDLEIQAAKSVDLEKQLKASQNRVAELEGKLSSLEKRVAELESSLSDKDKALQSALAEIETLMQQLKDAKATISEQQNKIEQLRAITSDEGAAQNLALAEEVKDIGIAKLATAEKGSEEYEAGLALLAVAAEADDPDLPEAVAAIPVVGFVAGQVLETMNDLGNIGADIAPEVRERSEEVVIAGVIVGGQVASASAVQAVRRKM
jgi:predicted  nucleic acid-binding Zn-ribbon protein